MPSVGQPPDAGQLIAYDVPFEGKLGLVGDVLPLAPTARPEVRAAWVLDPMGVRA